MFALAPETFITLPEMEAVAVSQPVPSCPQCSDSSLLLLQI